MDARDGGVSPIPMLTLSAMTLSVHFVCIFFLQVRVGRAGGPVFFLLNTSWRCRLFPYLMSVEFSLVLLYTFPT